MSKRKSAGLLIKIFLTCFLVIAVIIFIFTRIGVFTIGQVEVKTSQVECASENELKEASHGLFGQNFFVLDVKRFAKNLSEKFICIKNVNLSRVWPNKIEMMVTGRDPAAILVDLKSKPASASALTLRLATPSAEDIVDSYIVDSDGVIFAKNTTKADQPTIYLYNLNLSLGKQLPNDLMVNILKILDKVKTFGIAVKNSWVSDDFFLINYPSGPQIVFDFKDNIDIQLASLQLILLEAKIDFERLEFIDLRFDKPIIKVIPKGKGISGKR